MRPPAPVACADIVVLRSSLIPFPDLKHVGAFLSELKFRVRIARIAQKNAPIIFEPVNFIHFFCQAETGEPAHSTFFLDFDWLNLSDYMHIPIGQVKSDGSGAALAKLRNE